MHSVQRLFAALALLAPTGVLADRPVLSVSDGHAGQVSALAWNAEGTLLLSGGSDETARLWHVEQGALVRRFSSGVMAMRGIGRTIAGLGFVDEPAAVAIAGSFGAFAADLRTGKVTHELLPQEEYGNAIASIPGTSLVAVAHVSPYVRGTDRLEVHDLATGVVVSLLSLLGTIELSGVTALAPDSTGRFLALAGGRIVARDASNSIQTAPLLLVFNLRERRLVRAIRPEFPGTADWAALSPGAEDLFGLVGGEFRRWRVADGRLIDRHPANAAAVSPDARVIAKSVSDGSIRFISVEILEEGHTIASAPCPRMGREGCLWEFPRSIALSPDGRRVALGASHGEVAVYDITKGGYVRHFAPRATDPFHHDLLSDDGTHLLHPEQGAISLWDLRHGEIVHEHRASIEIDASAISPNGRRLAVGSRDGTVTIIDTHDGKAVRARLDSPVNALRFFRDGWRLAVANWSEARVINARTGGTLRVLGRNFNEVRAIAVSGNGEVIAIGDELGDIFVFGVGPEPSHLPAPEPYRSIVLDAEFDREGRRLLVGYGNGDNTIRLYELSTGETRFVGRHEGFVTGVAFGPREHIAFGGDFGATTKMWNIHDGRELAAIRHEAEVTTLEFDAGTGYLATLSGNRVELWDVAPDVAPAERLAKIADLVRQPNGNLVTFDAEGRFDAKDIEEIRGLHWIPPDAPLDALAPEIFFRQFYEPGLLGRLYACRRSEISGVRPRACGDTFAPVPPIADLNRRQPELSITKVSSGESPFEVIAEVTVTAASGPNGNFDPVYDLRIFRDGVLAAQVPSPPAPEVPWAALRIESVGDTQRQVVIDVPLRLARAAAEAPTRLSAYAFNGDRVRSARADRVIQPLGHSQVPGVRQRAFVIAVGVDQYEDPSLALDFAGADAQSLAEVLSQIAEHDVVPVTVISDNTRNHATKANFRAVLRILAGDPEASALRVADRPNGATHDRVNGATDGC